MTLLAPAVVDSIGIYGELLIITWAPEGVRKVGLVELELELELELALELELVVLEEIAVVVETKQTKSPTAMTASFMMTISLLVP